jgi:hypothetical protein
MGCGTRWTRGRGGGRVGPHPNPSEPLTPTPLPVRGKRGVCRLENGAVVGRRRRCRRSGEAGHCRANRADGGRDCMGRWSGRQKTRAWQKPPGPRSGEGTWPRKGAPRWVVLVPALPGPTGPRSPYALGGACSGQAGALAASWCKADAGGELAAATSSRSRMERFGVRSTRIADGPRGERSPRDTGWPIPYVGG